MVFNKKNLNFNKAKKQKARVKRKALQLSEKHKVAKKLQGGSRTKKSLRKQAHKERVADKAALTNGDQDEQMVEVSKSSLKRKNPKQQKKKLKLAQRPAAAGAAAAAAAEADAAEMED